MKCIKILHDADSFSAKVWEKKTYDAKTMYRSTEKQTIRINIRLESFNKLIKHHGPLFIYKTSDHLFLLSAIYSKFSADCIKIYY